MKSSAGIEGDQIDALMLMGRLRRIGAEDELRRDLAHPLEPGEAGGDGGVEGEVGRLRRQQSGRDIGQRALGQDEHVRAQAGEAHIHAALDAEHQHRTGEDAAGADRDCGEEEQAAGLAPPEVLEREAAEEEAKAARFRLGIGHGPYASFSLPLCGGRASRADCLGCFA